jgi:RNA polymerase sigma-70 factor (ECF subfamily)
MSIALRSDTPDQAEGPRAPTAAPSGFDLAAVVVSYESPLLRYVGQILGPRSAEVEEVVQDVFLRLQRQVLAKGLDSVQNLPSWLFRVAHNLAMDAGRRRRRQGQLEEAIMQDVAVHPLGATATAPPGEELARREAGALAVAEMQRLPEEQRHVLLLKVIQGLTLREISEITGMKMGTVNYRLTQGLKELARRLREAGAI